MGGPDADSEQLTDPALDKRVEDLRSFFEDPNHWIYLSKGTPSNINPSSVYHITQLQVLFEDRYFHKLTYRAIQRLIDEDFLSSRREKSGSITFVLVWRRNVRYVERPIKAHLDLATEYAEETVSKAVGRYAETLVSFGLRALGLQIHSRNTNKYNGKAWSKSQHDLDFIVEGPNAAYGVEVKNTFDYMPMNEFSIKLDMCNELGLIPLFIVRSRDSIQWRDTRERHGLIYMFKSKIFPPGYDDLVSRMWQDMRLPVTIWDDWRPSFYDTLSSFLQRGNTS